MQHQVLRPFNGAEGAELQPGQVVDTSSWRARNVSWLVARRYLLPVAGDAAPASAPKRGTVAAATERPAKSEEK